MYENNNDARSSQRARAKGRESRWDLAVMTVDWEVCMYLAIFEHRAQAFNTAICDFTYMCKTTKLYTLAQLDAVCRSNGPRGCCCGR